MRVLVLRDREAAAETAAALRARGHWPLLLPLARIEPLVEPPPADRFAALVATSRNAVPALLHHRERLGGVPAVAVGPATAAALKSAGYTLAFVGEGSAAALAAPAAALAERTALPVLLALGQTRAPDLEAGLSRFGVPFAVWETYATRSVEPSDAALDAALSGGVPNAALLLSASQATGFAQLGRRRPLFAAVQRLLCLSPRIAAVLPPPLRLKAAISASRSLDALFEALDGPNICGMGRAGIAPATR